METSFTQTAGLLAEPTRATMLLRLLGGRSLPAGELAEAANIAPQTASGHLAKLVGAQLLMVEKQGRHRYYRLAGAEVADALEAILVLLPRPGSQQSQSVPPPVGSLAHARTCYSHVAGRLGVCILDALVSKDYLKLAPSRALHVTEPGRVWFEELGISVPNLQSELRLKDARQCLDWTERRPHLAGRLGVNLYNRLIEQRWIAPIPQTRAIRLTLEGREELWSRLGISLGR